MDASFVLFRGSEDQVELTLAAACGRLRAERSVLLRLQCIVVIRGVYRLGSTYGVDVPAMSLELHERGIHAV